ncbi:MAG: hypothetical protein ACRD8O_23685 [Bryobacteraceae bacterium]
MREWWSKLRRAMPGRKGFADDLREELDAHLEMEIEDRGAPAAEVRRKFGNPTLIAERAREAWSFGLLETLLQDLRYGWRTFRRSLPWLCCRSRWGSQFRSVT